jgi:predicted acyl esterase
VLIDTPQPLRYELNRFTFTSRLIGKGHRLRLVIGPINSIHEQKNYNSGGVVADESLRDAKPVVVRLFHDEAHPSALYLPVAQSESEDSSS